MSEWKTLSVSEFAEVISGATPATNRTEYWNGSIEWVTPVDLSKLKTRFLFHSIRKISQNGLEASSVMLIPKMNIVMSSRAPIGYFAIPVNDFTTNQGCKSFKLKPGHDPEYHYYNFIFNTDYFKRFGSGSTFLEISKSDIEKLSFTVNVSLPKQRKIVRILSTVDAIIERTEAAIAKYQAIKQGMMHDLFSRGLDQNGKLRPRREEAPQLYHQTPLGWLPKEWEVVETDGKINVIDAQPDHRTPPEVLDGVPYVGIGDLKATGEIDFARARKVAKAALQKQVASFDIYPGAFIFGKIGTLGQPTRIPSERFFAVSANVVLLTTKLREDSDFIFWLYSSRLIGMQVKDATNTTSQPALGIQRVRKFLIPWPACSEERDKITSKLKAISNTLQNEEKHRDKALQVKQALMQALLTGRKPVVVSEDEQEN